MSEQRSVSVIGLGRVGLPLALCFADRGLRVLGVDHDHAILDSLRDGRMPFEEAGTQALLDRVRRTREGWSCPIVPPTPPAPTTS